MSSTTIWHFILWIHYLALGLWTGGIVFCSFVAAPAVHRSLATRAVAGQIVGALLKRLNAIEFFCCLLLLLTSLSALRFVIDRVVGILFLILLFMIMGGAVCIYAFYLTPLMESLKEKIPTLDALSTNHEDKKKFDRMHRLYVRLMGLNLILGLFALYVSIMIFH